MSKFAHDENLLKTLVEFHKESIRLYSQMQHLTNRISELPFQTFEDHPDLLLQARVTRNSVFELVKVVGNLCQEVKNV